MQCKGIFTWHGPNCAKGIINFVLVNKDFDTNIKLNMKVYRHKLDSDHDPIMFEYQISSEL